MKLAITVIPDTGRISPVFESAGNLLLVRLCRNGSYSIFAEEKIPENEVEKINFLRISNIRRLICGAISNETLSQLQNIGIRTLPFASGEWETVIKAALNQSEGLPSNLIMPGCCKHHRKCCNIQGGKNENCIHKSGRNA